MSIIEVAKKDLGKKIALISLVYVVSICYLYGMSKWVKIKDFPSYKVSSEGRIKATNYNHTGVEREIRIFKNIRGYMACNLMYKGVRKRKTVHQLVAIAFLDNPRALTQVNHKNGDKTDNRVSNLEWCTTTENIRHSFSEKLNIPKTGERHAGCKVSDEDVRDIRKLRLVGGMRLSSIAKLYGICFQNVSLICLNKTRTE